MFNVFCMGLVVGALLSGLSMPLTGQREAFDASPLYYFVGSFLAGALATLPAPKYWPVAILSVFLGEHLFYALVYPEMRPWFFWSLYINAMLPTWWAIAAGALLVFLMRRLLGLWPKSSHK
jgi:hypothetical protein